MEAYESLPGDSESAVDYGARVGTTVNNYLPTELGKYRELSVDITINMPDGTRFNYSEAIEKDEPDDYDFDEVADVLDSVVRVMNRRLGQPDVEA